ncbi:phosphoserine phosphatase SerB [Shewanella schlegeliana]|uniref:Phosphoserine phosphatase n=1 Tax=Shewanella schlegeliana TaxID=190308 RepID=A0ABS1T083_9GAMM|nr:phosphoserine phosphatase SerB [Shewanella schlegeliana]MBL4913579.1 phosphoserine phosphatase SerB [Shewanella schlegeliana]MCL1108470.1 phosphoserine phosphatase SerB [Shewanella schlegeliana]GIU28537.1 phosphoserine phosphatase SerB [Shewanella schlegeliana]
MESLSQSTVFAWLSTEGSMSFTAGEQSYFRHNETEYPKGFSRYRILFSELETLNATQLQIINEAVDRWLESLNCKLSLALIKRDCGLNCIEVCTPEPLSAEQIAAISETAFLELFELTFDAPQLSQVGLLVMDMDSTAIEIECIDELAAMAGVGPAVAEVTELAMQGELDFEQSLRARVAKLKGADAEIIDTLCAKLPLMPGLKEMVAELQSHGWRTVVASGGFTPFVNHLKQLLALDAAFANKLDIDNGKLLGTVSGQVVDAQYKADTVLNCAKQWQIAVGQRVAIGDGANDIPMINTADFGIAYHAKPKLVQAADVSINRLNLKVLPYLFQRT